MNTTPHPGDDPAMGLAPHPTEPFDDIEAIADLDPADAVEPAEELAKQLAASLMPRPARRLQRQSEGALLTRRRLDAELVRRKLAPSRRGATGNR